MRTIQVFDPPMCCSTGVCGEDVDRKLVQFAADVEWLKARGVTVRRFNLSQEPQTFMNEPEVLKAISFEGTRCLPLLVVDGRVVSRGTYPGREQLAALVGVASVENVAVHSARALPVRTDDAAPASTSCCTPSKGGKTGCCS